MQLADLPSRRNEAWKWSDLRAAMSGHEAMLARMDVAPGVNPIAGLAQALANAENRHRFTVGEHGDVWTTGIGASGGQVARIVAPSGTSGVVIERMSAFADNNTQGALKLSAALSDIEIEDHATLTRLVLQDASDQHKAAGIVQLNEANVRLGAGASFRQFIFAQGAGFLRVETHVTVGGAGAKVELNGLYSVENKRHADLTSEVVLEAEGAEVRQLVRGAAYAGGKGVFRGRFKVERAAQKADAQMQHNALLLEEGAEVFAKPELEIYADDVACAHGNTMGQLDEDAVFYLRQRGIPETRAREMITWAFLLEAIPDWLDANIRAELVRGLGMDAEAVT